ncbi:MAG: hypothetical protein M1814_001192 [Vezdaea aestivalis]|nr:MAG: hypothetical protein M1814_001192 [Vezdaea aestivalis]
MANFDNDNWSVDPAWAAPSAEWGSPAKPAKPTPNKNQIEFGLPGASKGRSSVVVIKKENVGPKHLDTLATRDPFSQPAGLGFSHIEDAPIGKQVLAEVAVSSKKVLPVASELVPKPEAEWTRPSDPTDWSKPPAPEPAPASIKRPWHTLRTGAEMLSTLNQILTGPIGSTDEAGFSLAKTPPLTGVVSKWSEQVNEATGFGGGPTYDGGAPEKAVETSGDEACRNCGETEHFTRECPQPLEMGACFNCGQDGHSKADCPNPKVFTGTCRTCNKNGHLAKECPDRPPDICKNCGQSGHVRKDCTNNRLVSHDHIATVGAAEAWAKIVAASNDKDIDAFKEGTYEYMKATPDMNYSLLEQSFRDHNLGFYLIAKERELFPTQMILGFRGQLDLKYHLQFHNGPRPRRLNQLEGWPETPEDNLERLKEAGEIADRGVPLCVNCGELGHIRKNCTEELTERERVQVNCFNCKEVGHRMRDCPVPRVDRNACRNCKELSLPEIESQVIRPRTAPILATRIMLSARTVVQWVILRVTALLVIISAEIASEEEGHRSSECENPRVMLCRNCDKIGHSAKECTEPKDWSRVKCNNCGKMGHTVRRCKEPIAEESDPTPEGNAAGGDPTSGADDGWGGAGPSAVGGEEIQTNF